eukprot:9499474-Pyramimonas_sp.AAC.1
MTQSRIPSRSNLSATTAQWEGGVTTAYHAQHGKVRVTHPSRLEQEGKVKLVIPNLQVPLFRQTPGHSRPLSDTFCGDCQYLHSTTLSRIPSSSHAHVYPANTH